MKDITARIEKMEFKRKEIPLQESDPPMEKPLLCETLHVNQPSSLTLSLGDETPEIEGLEEATSPIPITTAPQQVTTLASSIQQLNWNDEPNKSLGTSNSPLLEPVSCLNICPNGIVLRVLHRHALVERAEEPPDELNLKSRDQHRAPTQIGIYVLGSTIGDMPLIVMPLYSK